MPKMQSVSIGELRRVVQAGEFYASAIADITERVERGYFDDDLLQDARLVEAVLALSDFTASTVRLTRALLWRGAAPEDKSQPQAQGAKARPTIVEDAPGRLEAVKPVK